MESSALEVTRKNTASIFSSSPSETVRYASELAAALSPIVEKQKMYTVIGGKRHVRVDVTELPDGSYEARVDLLNKDGRVVGGASALCGIEEQRWRNADRYARRSMAVTRATAKAYRVAFSWIIQMTGYEVTPAEEMPHDKPSAPPVAAARKGQKKAEGFDPNIKAHADWIEKELKSRGVDESLWDDVALTLTGRPSDAFDDVLKTVTGAL